MNWTLSRWLKFLFNQKGEVPETPEESGDEPGPQPEPSPEPSEEAPEGEQAPAAKKIESFIDPATLPEELKPHWKRMHGSFTKFKQSEKQLRTQAEMVERFNTDPEFARATIQQRAAQLGFQLVPLGSNGQQQPVTQARAGTPSQFLELAQSKLPPELHWMAPSIAESAHAIVQAALEPLVKQQREQTTQARESEMEKYEAELDEKYPGWEEHEDTMVKLLNWWKSDSLHHPIYGSKVELLLKMATDQATSVSEATKRLNSAVRNRSSSSHVFSSSAPNVLKRVREAKTNSEAWDIATKHAVEQVKARAG